MSDFDGAWKDTLDYFLRPFLALFCPDIHDDIDWTTDPESLEQELRASEPQAVSGKVVCDKLLRLHRVGTDDPAYLHIEGQNQRDDDLPQRVKTYNRRASDKYGQPIVSVVILGDDNPRWAPGPYLFERWGCRDELAYRPIKLLRWRDRDDELLGHDNVVALVVLAHLKAIETRQLPDERMAWRLRIVRRIYQREMEHEDRRRLLPIVEGILDLPDDLEAEVRRTIVEEQEGPTVQRVSSFERLAKVEGEEKGLRQGIRAILELRFGQADPSLLDLLDHAPLANLEQALQAAKSVGNPDDLRPLLEPPSNGQP